MFGPQGPNIITTVTHICYYKRVFVIFKLCYVKHYALRKFKQVIYVKIELSKYEPISRHAPVGTARFAFNKITDMTVSRFYEQVGL